MGVHLEAKYLLKWLAFNLKSQSNLFPINIGGIKYFLIITNCF